MRLAADSAPGSAVDAGSLQHPAFKHNFRNAVVRLRRSVRFVPAHQKSVARADMAARLAERVGHIVHRRIAAYNQHFIGIEQAAGHVERAGTGLADPNIIVFAAAHLAAGNIHGSDRTGVLSDLKHIIAVFVFTPHKSSFDVQGRAGHIRYSGADGKIGTCRSQETRTFAADRNRHVVGGGIRGPERCLRAFVQNKSSSV